MKLRFVKFLTSLENEIEKKEGGEEEGPPLRVLPSPPAGRAQSSPRSHFCFLFLSSFPHSFPPQPHQPTSSVAPACRPPRVGRAIFPSYPSPAVLLLPSFFIKLPKQKSVAVVTWRGTQLAGPAVACVCPARPQAPPPGGPLVLRFLSSLSAVHPHRAEP